LSGTVFALAGGAFFAINTDDGVVDGNWSAPSATDPQGDVSEANADITRGWFSLDAPTPTTYYFRMDVSSGPIGSSGSAYVWLDCDQNGSFVDTGIDKKIGYWVGYDYPSDGFGAVFVSEPLGGGIATYDDDYGEVAGSKTYEFKALAADLGDCATPPFNVRFDSGLDTTDFSFALNSVTVGPDQGGILVYTDTHGLTTTVEIPPNVVSETTTVYYTALPDVTSPSGFGFADHGFDLDAYRDNTPLATLAFSSAVTITLQYTDTDILAMEEDQLSLQTWDDATGAWVDAACGAYERHPSQNWLAVPICHLSRFALFGPREEIYLPLVLRGYPEWDVE
jgi:hypothetical protein